MEDRYSGQLPRLFGHSAVSSSENDHSPGTLSAPKGPDVMQVTIQNSNYPCELLLRTRLVPVRVGADTQVIAHIWLSQLPQVGPR